LAKLAGSNLTQWVNQVALSLGGGVDYDGGGTRYAAYNCTLSLRKGEGTLFPGQLWHSGERVTSGTRYMLVGFSQSEAGGGDDVDAVAPSDFGDAPYRVTLRSLGADDSCGDGDDDVAPTLDLMSPPRLHVVLAAWDDANSTDCSRFAVRYAEKERKKGTPAGLVWLYHQQQHQQFRERNDVVANGGGANTEFAAHAAVDCRASRRSQPAESSLFPATTDTDRGRGGAPLVEAVVGGTQCQFSLDEVFVASHPVVLMLLPPRHEFTSFALKPAVART